MSHKSKGRISEHTKIYKHQQHNKECFIYSNKDFFSLILQLSLKDGFMKVHAHKSCVCVFLSKKIEVYK